MEQTNTHTLWHAERGPAINLKCMKVSQTSLFESHFKPGRCLRSLKDVRAQIDHSFRKSLSERAKRASCAVASEASSAVASEASNAVASEASNGGWGEGGPPSAAIGLTRL